jgi:hypothetical protein
MAARKNPMDLRTRREEVKRDGRKHTRKHKCTIILSAEAHYLLEAHKSGSGRERSAIVDELIRTHCRRYTIHDNGEPMGQPAGDSAAA